jgi:hypothetical protein
VGDKENSMIVHHKTFRKGTQTVCSTVYAINAQGFAEMSEDHAAIVLSVPSAGWEKWEAPKPVAAENKVVIEVVKASPKLEGVELVKTGPEKSPYPPAPEVKAEEKQQTPAAPSPSPAPEVKTKKAVQIPENLENLNRSSLLELASSLGVDLRTLRKASNEGIILAIRGAKE